jgi:hypothetical protein
MKRIIATLGALALGATLPLMAETTTTQETATSTNADGSKTTTETTTTTFTPEYRTKVVKYFDTYKTNPHGLPPAWASKVKVKEVPATWRATISPGMVIAEKERSYLVDAPPDLVEVLPPARSGVRYYVAGSNVVAVDSASYKVVDSISIPSIKIEAEDD